MIDTVVLNIPRNQILDFDPDGKAQPWDLQSRTSMYEKYTKNPSRRLHDGIYRPRLTGMNRKIGGGVMSSFVKIEFSIPKLMYGNNLDEVEEADVETVVGLLRDRLREAGLEVFTKTIEHAAVAAFHPSKNIMLSDGYTASFVINEIAKVNLNKKFDLTKTSFRNGGKSVQGYTMSHSVVVYDKISDLAQCKKRAIDKDQTLGQISLFQTLITKEPSPEVLRLEIRLTQKQKINGLLKKLGFPINPTFADIFKKDVCQKIVQFYWDTMIEGENLFLFSINNNPQNLLRRLLRERPRLSAKEVIYLVGLDILAKDRGGITHLRDALKNRVSQRNWYRISKGMGKLNHTTRSQPLHGWVSQVRESIRKFEPYRIRLPPP